MKTCFATRFCPLTSLLAVWLMSDAAIAQPAVRGAAEVRTAAARTNVVRVIAGVAVRPEGDSLANQSGFAASQNSLVRSLATSGATYVRPITNLPYVVAEVNRSQLETLIASRQVVSVQQDRLSKPVLIQSAPLIGADKAWSAGARGRGQTVAILDTGVDRNHLFLAGRVVREACFSSNSPAYGARSVCPINGKLTSGPGSAVPCRVSGCDHGTHVAGIAAGRGPVFSGIAPDANIVAIQVFSRFDDQPGGPQTCADAQSSSPCVLSFTSDLIRALGFVLSERGAPPVAAVNLSLGGGHHTGSCDDNPLKPLIDELRTANIATVVAAGNGSHGDAVGAPGCISTAVTVGSTTKTDAISPFSNNSAIVDVLAPGSSILSSIPGHLFALKSGTSMATPHVTGAFAALRSALPNASVADIEGALKLQGKLILDARNGLTKPRVDVLAALKWLQALKTLAAIADSGSVTSSPTKRGSLYEVKGYAQACTGSAAGGGVLPTRQIRPRTSALRDRLCGNRVAGSGPATAGERNGTIRGGDRSAEANR